MEDGTSKVSVTNSDDDDKTLSFSQRRTMKRKREQHKNKGKLKELRLQDSESTALIQENLPKFEPPADHVIHEEKNNMGCMQTMVESEAKHKFEAVSHPNELQIDPADIMNDVELIKRKADHMLAQSNAMNHKMDTFSISESYIQTKSLQFIRLRSEKNMSDRDDHNLNMHNTDLIVNESIICIVQSEMMSVFTWIIGIVDGVLFCSLFSILTHSNIAFLQKFASSFMMVQFASYFVGLLLIPFSFILLHRKEREIYKWQTRLFVLCSLSVFICIMIEFPISDELYSLYHEDNKYFSHQSAAVIFSANVTKWKKLQIAKFCFLTSIWVLCVTFFRQSKSTEKKD